MMRTNLLKLIAIQLPFMEISEVFQYLLAQRNLQIPPDLEDVLNRFGLSDLDPTMFLNVLNQLKSDEKFSSARTPIIGWLYREYPQVEDPDRFLTGIHLLTAVVLAMKLLPDYELLITDTLSSAMGTLKLKGQHTLLFRTILFGDLDGATLKSIRQALFSEIAPLSPPRGGRAANPVLLQLSSDVSRVSRAMFSLQIGGVLGHIGDDIRGVSSAYELSSTPPDDEIVVAPYKRIGQLKAEYFDSGSDEGSASATDSGVEIDYIEKPDTMFPYLDPEVDKESTAPVSVLWRLGKLSDAVYGVATFLESTKKWSQFERNANFLAQVCQYIDQYPKSPGAKAYLGRQEPGIFKADIVKRLREALSGFLASRVAYDHEDALVLRFRKILFGQESQEMILTQFPDAQAPILSSDVMLEFVCRVYWGRVNQLSAFELENGQWKEIVDNVESFLALFQSAEARPRTAPLSLILLSVTVLKAHFSEGCSSFLLSQYGLTPKASWVADASRELVQLFQTNGKGISSFARSMAASPNEAGTMAGRVMVHKSMLMQYLNLIFPKVREGYVLSQDELDDLTTILLEVSHVSITPLIEFFSPVLENKNNHKLIQLLNDALWLFLKNMHTLVKTDVITSADSLWQRYWQRADKKTVFAYIQSELNLIKPERLFIEYRIQNANGQPVVKYPFTEGRSMIPRQTALKWLEEQDLVLSKRLEPLKLAPSQRDDV